jgi:CRP-like cAMP-binding protein
MAQGVAVKKQDQDKDAGSRRPRTDDVLRLVPWLRQRNSLVQRLDDACIKLLFEGAVIRSATRETVLLATGEPQRYIFLLTDGHIAQRIESNKIQREVSSFGPGEIAGLSALVDQEAAPYDLVAVNTVEFVRIDCDILARYTAVFHPVMMRLLNIAIPDLVTRLRGLVERSVVLAARKSATLSGDGITLARFDR